MVMETTSPSIQGNYPTNISLSGYSNQQAKEKTSDRKSKVNQVPKQSVHCSEKRFIRGEMDHGSLGSQRMYYLPKVSHAENAGCKTPVTETLLDSGAGPEGRFLAYPHLPPQAGLFGLQIPGPVLSLQGHALWLKYCTPHFHKSYGPRGQTYGRGGDICADISRRYAHRSTNKGNLLGTKRQGNSNLRKPGVDYQHREISSRTSSNLRLAGRPPESAFAYSKCYPRQHGRVKKPTGFINQVQLHHTTHNNAFTRVGELDWPNKSNCSNACIQNKSATEEIQREQIRCSNSANKKYEAQSHQMGIHHFCPSEAREPHTHSDHPNGCVTQGLGVPDRSTSLPRRIRSINEVLFNKHPGTSHNMVCLTSSYQGQPGDSDSLRQLDCRSSSQTQQFNKISSINDFRADLEKSNRERLDNNSITHSREVQCGRRPIESQPNKIDRMVPTPRSVQTNHEIEPTPADRPVCHTPEQSAGNLHLALSGSRGGGSGRHGNSMAQMATSIPLSPVHHDFEGFTQIDGISVQECNTNNTRHSDQTLVHGIETASDPFNNNDGVSAAVCSGQTGNSSLSYQTTRLEVIKQAYSKQYPNCPDAITLMATPIRNSSINEYQKKWNRFMVYLESHNIPFEKITITSVINFLSHLFKDKHLSPNTVAHYKSALIVPLQAHFNIDLNVNAIKEMIRAMYLLRPNIPVLAPRWSLNKVLTFIDDLTDPITTVMLLRKTAFLLMLATGYRISELQACVRDQNYCYFTGDGILHIRLHPSLLAKNESPRKRWDFKVIKSLRLQDGTISKLCPVTSLQEYLRRTEAVDNGRLFLKPNNEATVLSIDMLRSHICNLIKLADPVSRIWSHDVRKYSASCSFVNTMLMGDLLSAMNWSSAATFTKHYFCKVDPLCTTVALPVGNQ